jgi:hypothetical protein
MSTSGHELGHDCTAALRMIPPHRAIETRSIEAYWGRWDCSDEPRGRHPPLSGMRPRRCGRQGCARVAGWFAIGSRECPGPS